LTEGIQGRHRPDDSRRRGSRVTSRALPLKGLLPHGSCRCAPCSSTAGPGRLYGSRSAWRDRQNKATRCSALRRTSSRCSSSRATTSACSARRAAIASYRRWRTLRDYSAEVPVPVAAAEVDASHPDLFLDRNRCVLCGRFARPRSSSTEARVRFRRARALTSAFRGERRSQLAGTQAKASDKARRVGPVGALLKKRSATAVPIGQRKYDHQPIGSEIEPAAKK